MELRAAGTRIRIHPLFLLLPPVAALLGLHAEIAAMLLSLTAHECAHLACARLARVRVDELWLMPFGGSARMGSLYALSPRQMLAVAAAGPAANLLLLLVAAALAHWGALSPARALVFFRINLTLMLFNLLPALPLDGGRMLYAITVRRLGRSRSVSLGIWLGRALALALIAAAIRSVLLTGRFNLSYLSAAIFIVSSANGERQALCDASLSSLLRAALPLDRPMPMRLCAINADCTAQQALLRAPPDAATLYVVYYSDRIIGVTDDRQLLGAALSDPARRVKDAGLYQVSMPHAAKRAV